MEKNFKSITIIDYTLFWDDGDVERISSSLLKEGKRFVAPRGWCQVIKTNNKHKDWSRRDLQKGEGMKRI